MYGRAADKLNVSSPSSPRSCRAPMPPVLNTTVTKAGVLVENLNLVGHGIDHEGVAVCRAVQFEDVSPPAAAGKTYASECPDMGKRQRNVRPFRRLPAARRSSRRRAHRRAYTSQDRRRLGVAKVNASVPPCPSMSSDSIVSKVIAGNPLTSTTPVPRPVGSYSMMSLPDVALTTNVSLALGSPPLTSTATPAIGVTLMWSSPNRPCNVKLSKLEKVDHRSVVDPHAVALVEVLGRDRIIAVGSLHDDVVGGHRADQRQEFHSHKRNRSVRRGDHAGIGRCARCQQSSCPRSYS